MMLFYTSKNHRGEVSAIYNGCHAFIHFPKFSEYEAADTFRRGQPLSKFVSHRWQPRNALSLQVLSHEYLHRCLFSSSKVGTILNGLQHQVVNDYLARQSKDFIEDYYQMRTEYFFRTTAVQELFVRLFEEYARTETRKVQIVRQRSDFRELPVLTQQCHELLQDIDSELLRSWKKRYPRHHEQFENCYLPLGQTLNKHFAILLSYRDKYGKHTHKIWGDYRNSDDSMRSYRAYSIPWHKAIARTKTGGFMGIIEDLESQSETTIRLAEGPTLPRQGKFDVLIDWFQLSQRSQFIACTAGFQICLNVYREMFLAPSVMFLSEWAGVQFGTRASLLEFSEDAFTMQKRDLIKKWSSSLTRWKSINAMHRFFEFFIKQGN